jgi:hypothetical protein
MRLLVLAAVLLAQRGAAQAQCVGDCLGDGSVTINDLILGVNIALGLQPTTACPAFQNSQGQVDIAQLIKGVSNALNGCPVEPTATATNPSTPTLTATPVATATHTLAPTATATNTTASTPTHTTVATATHTIASTPTSTATHTVAATGTSTATHTTAASTPTVTGSPESTATATHTAPSTATHTAPSTGTATATASGTPAQTGTATATPPATGTATDTPTAQSTATASGSPTPTPTVTVTSTASATPTGTPTKTPTQTPIPVGELVAGHAAIVSAGLGSVQSLIAAVVAQATNTGATLSEVSSPLDVGVDEVQVTDLNTCSVSGTSERTCTEMGAGLSKSIDLLLDANNCIVGGATGGTAEFNGKIRVESSPGPVGDCSPLAFLSGSYHVGDQEAPGGPVPLDVIFRNNLMQQTLGVSALLSGTVGILSASQSCLIGSLNLTLEGNLTSQLADGSSIDLSFFDTGVVIDMITYNADCVPLSYRLKFNGLASFSVTPPAPAVAVTNGEVSIPGFNVQFTNFFLTQHIASGSVTTEMSGQMSSDCFGGLVGVTTMQSVVVASGDVCPNAGQLNLTSAAGPATVTYQDSQVTVAQGGSETVFPSCLSPELVTCVPQ